MDNSGYAFWNNEDEPGLTKREYFAAMAMQGMLANPTGDAVYASSYAKAAVTSADALLAELAKEQT